MASALSKASQACASCRKHKRKCDKAQPICGLCSRLGRACDYAAIPAQTAEDTASLQARLSELERELRASKKNPGNETTPPADSSGHSNNSAGWQPANPLWMGPASMNRFPSAVFLDIDCFKWAQLPIPRPNVNVPPEVFEILSNGNAVQSATAEFFSTIHYWFPIVSRKRMTIGTSLWEGGPDLAMLFLAMLLINSRELTSVEAAMTNQLYTASKRFLALLEASGTVSLLYLQAMILVAMYEYGHGIYPSAWMTIAQCARYVDVTGIPSFKDSSLMLGSCATWTEVEERRRAWWAIYILDRAICLGNKKRYTMPEPDENCLLPVDDSAWDDGDPSRGRQIPIDTPLSQPQGAFTRLAQAAMLISKTTNHCRTAIRNTQRLVPEPFNLAPITDLIDTLVSFTHILKSELPKSSPDCFPTSRPHSLGLTSPPPVTTPTTITTTAAINTPSPNRPTLSPPQFPPQPPETPCHKAYFSLLPCRALTLSSLILLLDIYSCPENLRDGPGPSGLDAPMAYKSADELTMQARAVTGLQETALAARDLALEILDCSLLPGAVDRVSSLCLDALYGAMATLHWLWKEGGDAGVREQMEDIQRCMGRLAWRWKVAGEYVELLHYHNVTTVMAWKGIGPS